MSFMSLHSLQTPHWETVTDTRQAKVGEERFPFLPSPVAPCDHTEPVVFLGHTYELLDGIRRDLEGHLYKIGVHGCSERSCVMV